MCSRSCCCVLSIIWSVHRAYYFHLIIGDWNKQNKKCKCVGTDDKYNIETLHNNNRIFIIHSIWTKNSSEMHWSPAVICDFLARPPLSSCSVLIYSRARVQRGNTGLCFHGYCHASGSLFLPLALQPHPPLSHHSSIHPSFTFAPGPHRDLVFSLPSTFTMSHAFDLTGIHFDAIGLKGSVDQDKTYPCSLWRWIEVYNVRGGPLITVLVLWVTGPL